MHDLDRAFDQVDVRTINESISMILNMVELDHVCGTTCLQHIRDGIPFLHVL